MYVIGVTIKSQIKSSITMNYNNMGQPEYETYIIGNVGYKKIMTMECKKV